MLEEDVGLLSSTKDDSLNNDSEGLKAWNVRFKPSRSWLLHWIFHAILLGTSLPFFFSSLRNYASNKCPGDWCQYSKIVLYELGDAASKGDTVPIMTDYAPIHTVRFNGTFKRGSKFKGPPSKAVDEAWESIAPLSFMTIPEDIFQLLNASKYAAEAPPKASGDRLALFEAVHQIHCVKTLWMTTYPDYYTEEAAWAQEKPDEWRAHIDHCADMLRQKLMCDADASLITYNWVQNHYSPHPNFNVQHQCRDYNRLLDVARQYRLEEGIIKGGRNGHIVRPLDKDVVDFPEPPFDPLAEN